MKRGDVYWLELPDERRRAVCPTELRLTKRDDDMPADCAISSRAAGDA